METPRSTFGDPAAVTMRKCIQDAPAIGEAMSAQDNRMTSHPIYWAEQRITVTESGGHSVRTWAKQMMFFTQAACEAYIVEQEGPNPPEDEDQRDWRMYIGSGHENQEWITARGLLLRAAAKPYCHH